MGNWGTTKTKHRVKVAALILLAAVSLSVAGIALAVQNQHDGSAPPLIQEAMRNGPKIP